jgi:hypothetical protein
MAESLSKEFYMTGIHIDSLTFNFSVQREVFTNYIKKFIHTIRKLPA